MTHQLLRSHRAFSALARAIRSDKAVPPQGAITRCNRTSGLSQVCIYAAAVVGFLVGLQKHYLAIASVREKGKKLAQEREAERDALRKENEALKQELREKDIALGLIPAPTDDTLSSFDINNPDPSVFENPEKLIARLEKL